LAGHSERVPDLLPGPAGTPRLGDVQRLDPLGEPVQGPDRTEAGGGVHGGQGLDIPRFHVCQSGLTLSDLSSQTDRMNVDSDAARVWDVAIVGAGPVGLLLAGELAARGTRSIVLERAESRSPVPKANGIVGHSAVELRRRGVFAGTRIRVLSPPRFSFGPLVLRLGFGPGNPLHIVPVPQALLEELLERRATARGAEVRRGHEVIGFSQDDAGVELEVSRGGTLMRIAARCLVGCDGAHSLVRKQAGIGFPGFTSDEISRMARVTVPADRITRRGDSLEIAGVGRVAAMRPNQLSGGSFSIAPMSVLDRAARDDLYLVSTHEPRGDEDSSESVSIDELRASLHRVLGAELPMTEATAIRSTVGNSRHADAYRRGRVFLAGDSAHIFNAGGSALNVGLQDALDLAGRLPEALRGEAAIDGLDGYEEARRPAGERALLHTRAQAALGRNDESGQALREIVSVLISRRGGARSVARLMEQA
jgi:2-polyprenyl-6-methoxyphenol hydroxylase-like FAD-dependent oxidoreductase